MKVDKQNKKDNYDLEIKQSKSLAFKVKLFVIISLTIAVLLNVLFAWALPTREVECLEDKILLAFRQLFLLLNLTDGQTNIMYFVLGLSFDLLTSYLIYKFILMRGDVKFFSKILLIISFRLLCDFFYHPKLDDEGHLPSYFYSISFSKNNGTLVSHSISITFLGFINIFKSLEYSRTFKIIIFVIILFQNLMLLLLNSKFSIQIIFSFILAHYIDLVVK